MFSRARSHSQSDNCMLNEIHRSFETSIAQRFKLRLYFQASSANGSLQHRTIQQSGIVLFLRPAVRHGIELF